MPLKAESADGVVHEFPDGTAPDVIDRAMKEYSASMPKPMSRMERVGAGFMDPFYGAAQVGARMTDPGEEAAGLVDPRHEQYRTERREQIDKMVREREAGIQSRRGKDTGVDWYRAAGSLTNPLTIGMGAMGFAGGGIPGAALTGGLTAFTEPVTGEHFGSEKAGQVAVGTFTGGVLGTAGKFIGSGVRSLGAYLAREFPENVMTQSVQKILKRIGQDEKAGGLTAQQMIDVINEASRRGKPLTIADVGGENTLSLAGNVARQPGEARDITTQFLNQRDKGAGKRIAEDIRQHVSTESMQATTDALIAARSAEGKPAWDAVRQMQGVWSPRLEQFIQDPTIRRGMARGYEIERLESLAEGRPFNPTQMGVDLDAEGNVKIIAAPDMRVLHMAKMGLDAMIAEAKDQFGRPTQMSVALDKARRAYLQEIDSLDTQGIYRTARGLWEGRSESLQAVRAGRDIFKGQPEDIAREFASLSPSSQEFYRIGAADAMRERIMKSGVSADEAKALIKSPWMQEQMRPIFRSPKEFDDFVQSVAWEGDMFGTKFAVKGGSQTAARLAEDQSGENLLSAGGAKIAENMASGSWLSAIKNAVRLWRDLGIQPNPKMNEQVARILFQTPIDPASEVGQRLTGKWTGTMGVNRLAAPADVVERAAATLAPGAGAAMGQEQSPFVAPLR